MIDLFTVVGIFVSAIVVIGIVAPVSLYFCEKIVSRWRLRGWREGRSLLAGEIRDAAWWVNNDVMRATVMTVATLIFETGRVEGKHLRERLGEGND